MRGFITCLLLTLLLASPAAGYTLVMRGGRRVEIADNFRLSGAQLTYEAAPGVSVTLPLGLVDVAATERANNEPSGSFFRRAAAAQQAQEQRPPDSQTGAATRQPARTLTNRELEPVRRARVESERAYERRRAELGLPSAEEARRRDREEERAMSERARQKAEEEADAEGHWRERAAALREEAAALDAEINYLRGLLAESSAGSTVNFSSSPGLAAGALTVIAGAPFHFGRGGFGRGNFPSNLPVGTAFARNPANALLLDSGGRRFTRAPVGFNLGRARATLGFAVNGGARVGFGLNGRDVRGKFARPLRRGRFTHGRSPFFAPGLVGVVAPFDYASADAFALATRLRLLEGERAGLSARWRLLEEEARRGGAQPGWLRP
jgi:hypothetical protein